MKLYEIFYEGEHIATVGAYDEFDALSVFTKLTSLKVTRTNTVVKEVYH